MESECTANFRRQVAYVTITITPSRIKGRIIAFFILFSESNHRNSENRKKYFFHVFALLEMEHCLIVFV